MVKVKVGISACLLGQPVRYNGSHKLDVYLREVLGPYVAWVPVCPETECGLPTPREPMELWEGAGQQRLVTNSTGIDLTLQMTSWCGRRLKKLEDEGVGGFILKQDSPSCGLQQVRLHCENHRVNRKGRGLFAQSLLVHFPKLPVVEAEKLRNRWERECFLDRIFTAERWRTMGQADGGTLVDFYNRHRLMVLSHSAEGEADLAHWARAGAVEACRAVWEQALSTPSGKNGHCRMMGRMLCDLKPVLSAWESEKLEEAISRYQTGHTGMSAALSLFFHYAEKYENHDLMTQTCRDWLLPVYEGG